MTATSVRDHHKRNETCPNCGQGGIASSAFCPACGQENKSLDLPFGHLLQEAVEHTLHIDGKLFRTMGSLLVRPGFLTSEFIAGRRERYVPPIRLYVFTSVLFFFLLAVLPRGAAEGAREPFSVSLYGMDSKSLVGLDEAGIDSAMAANDIERTPFNRYMARKVALVGAGGREAFGHLMLKNISYMMFGLMPLFGAFVTLVFRRSAKRYVRGLMYAIHVHAFLFLLLALGLVAAKLAPAGAVTVVAATSASAYFYLSLKRLFGEGWFRTLWKAAVLGMIHIISIFCGFLLVVLASVIFV
jgi:hypothetical protein